MEKSKSESGKSEKSRLEESKLENNKSENSKLKNSKSEKSRLEESKSENSKSEECKMEEGKSEKKMQWEKKDVEAGSFDALCGIIAALRDENGCPWDRAQTMESLKPCMINEMTEALGAIDIYEETGEFDNLCEELGDVLLQVVLQAQIASEKGLFTIHDVVRGISQKMIRRHPHVFGEAYPEGFDPASAAEGSPSREEIPGLWEAVKRAEKEGRTAEQKQREREAFRKSALDVIGHLAAAKKVRE